MQEARGRGVQVARSFSRTVKPIGQSAEPEVCPELREDRFMVGDLAPGYMGGLPPAQAEQLARVNGPGLAALREYLALGQAVAFWGRGCRRRCIRERRALVKAVDGHALATGVLAGLLADHPPAGDIDALRGELATAARTDARVGRVLQFYAGRLSEPDRYLLAAVSLFARPVLTATVLAVARHDAFADRLAGWTPAMMRAAVLA
jgi:hypothetical protein